jgi:hypothetical protein
MPCLKWITALLALSALPAAAGPDSHLKRAELSARLYDEGVAADETLLVIAAAKLRKDIGLTGPVPLGWEAMLDAAQTMAADDPDLLSVIDDIRNETSKGVASGPEYQIAALAPGASDQRPAMAFRGGEYAEVYVEAPSGVDLNLTVLDAAGLVVCADTDVSHVAYCGWTPATDGDFVLVIENAGAVAADYALMTN